MLLFSLLLLPYLSKKKTPKGEDRNKILDYTIDLNS